MPGRAEQGTFDWKPTKAPATTPPPRPALGPADRHRWLTADEATAYLGLPTRKALYAAAEHYLRLEGFSAEQVLETKLLEGD